MSAPFGRPPYSTIDNQDIYDEIQLAELHQQGHEHWLGISADQAGDNWGADRLSPFVCTSGDADYTEGGAAKLLGIDDTPVFAGNSYFDIHRILITGVSLDTVYKIRLIWGTGTMNEAIAVDQKTEVMIKFDAANPQQSAGIPFDILMDKIAVGVKMWAQCKNLADLATVSFYIGLHEYAE